MNLYMLEVEQKVHARFIRKKRMPDKKCEGSEKHEKLPELG